MNATSCWKPVRNGPIYCSPMCGAGCTHEAYRQAKVAANVLAAKLGHPWKPRVWENLGWHFSAVNTAAKAEIYRNGPRDYTLHWNIEPQIVIANARSPVAAIRGAKRKLEAMQKRLLMMGGHL